MKKFCNKCNKTVETKIISKAEDYLVCGEKIHVNAKVRVCTECGSALFDEELDDKTLIAAYDKYKQNNHLLSSKDIVEIRNKYGLSQRSLAKLLGWGDKTIFRYENGSLQDKAHNYILEQLKDEKNMLQYLETNKNRIDENVFNKIYNSINKEKLPEIFNYDNEFTYGPSIYSGYKKFDIDKTCAMIEYFVDKLGKIQITKLLKLINYSDMIFFKENTISISGLRYIHYPYGPIPENYELILHYMTSNAYINQSYEFGNNYEYHFYHSSINNKIDCLTKEEKQILERVYNKFKNFGSVQISEYSHNEKGYKETKNNDYISYEYADEINL